MEMGLKENLLVSKTMFSAKRPPLQGKMTFQTCTFMPLQTPQKHDLRPENTNKHNWIGQGQSPEILQHAGQRGEQGAVKQDYRNVEFNDWKNE